MNRVADRTLNRRRIVAKPVFAAFCVVFCAGLWPAPVAAHDALNQLSSFAVDPQGRWLASSSFGLLRGDLAKPDVGWICAEAFAVGGDIFDREVTYADGRFVVRAANTLAESVDAGCQWSTPAPLANATVADIDAAGGWMWAAGAQGDAPAVWRLSGGTWTPSAAAPAGPIVAIAASHAAADRALAVTGSAAPFKLARTVDGGKQWLALPLPVDAEKPRPLREGPNPTQALLVVASAGLGDALLRSAAGQGTDWQDVIKNKVGVDIDAYVWLGEPATPSLLVASAAAGIWRSDDGGKTFAAPVKGPWINCLWAHDGALYACADNYFDYAAVSKSINGGAAWTPTTCFYRIESALSCLGAGSVCATKWPALAESKGLIGDAPCGTPVRVPGADAGSTTADASTDAPSADIGAGETLVDVQSAAVPTSAVLPSRDDSGCSARSQTPLVPLPVSIWLLTLAGCAIRRCRQPNIGAPHEDA